jgi:uncharacterized protein (TIGR03118 family)
MARTTSRGPTSRIKARLCLEALEDRCLLSGNVLQTNLVSDLPGVAAVQDPNLVNPWGISESPGSPFWISDNNAGVSTLYNTPGQNGAPIAINPLVVSIPTPGNSLGSTGTPTGTVFNTDGGTLGGFQVSGVDKNGNPITAPAIFLFDTEDGTLVGWNPAVNPKGFDPAKAGTYGIIAVDNSGNNFTNPDPNQQTGAVYKGLTIATSATPIIAGDPNSTALIYASNFRAGTIDVYDAAFHKVTTLPTGAFTDPNLPRGYAPFNVQVLNNQLFVTYAKQNAAKHDDVAGPGNGFVDVFNLNGTPGLAGGQVRLISRGVLDSPWGLAIAPSSFGSLGGDLLVGNFGNGFINVFNPTTGQSLGQLKDPDGEPIQIDGLWALTVGNGGAGGSANAVYFTAGLFGETHGLFGSLAPVAPGTPEGPAEQQLVTADFDVFQLAVQTFNNDLASGASRTQLRQDIQAVDTALQDFVRAEVDFVLDTRADQGGHGSAHFPSVHDLNDLFAVLDDHDLH